MYNTQDFSFSTKCSCTHNPSSFQASMNPGAYFQVLCMFRHGKNLCYILLWLILWLMGSHQITTELGNFSLRLWVHVYGTVYVTNLPLWLLQKPVLRVPTPTSDRMSNGFLWIILGLCLLIESSLVHLQRAHASATCVLSVHQMEAVVVGNLYINLLAQMHTDYSTPVVSSAYRATWRIFENTKYSLFAYEVHVSVCLQSSWVPALRAFQSLQLCSSPSCKQKCFMLPCSKLLWLCLSCK